MGKRVYHKSWVIKGVKCWLEIDTKWSQPVIHHVWL